MGLYILKRLGLAVPTLIGSTIIVFLLIHLAPGDPAVVYLGPDARPEDVVTLRRHLGLDRPLAVQYWLYITHAVQGDLGRSFYYKEEISRLVFGTLPHTIELTAAALVISLCLALPLGIAAALRPHSIVDYLSSALAVAGVAIPVFWLAIMLIFVVAVHLQWLPASGRGGPLWSLEGIRHIVLPALALGLGLMASTARLTRSSMLEVLDEEYVRTARAKGLTARTVTIRHALRNALIPIVTNVSLQVGLLLGGAFLTETVFSWPGIGRLAVDAMVRRDYPLLQGVLLVTIVFFILVNLVVDLVYPVIDPRIRVR
ncbi:MAG: ABC transporter permease [Armatimonadota bacterium]|nr:ABC transporter permease [Armatimonadota bacterium]